MQLGGAALAAAAVAGPLDVRAAVASPRALVLYDSTDPTYGYIGELYAMMVVNQCGHFGSWTAQPVTNYTAGLMSGYTAVIYIGCLYNEPLPSAFLNDVLNTAIPVIWMYDNIWQLQSYIFNTTGVYFTNRYGWTPGAYDNGTVSQVNYKATALTRFPGTTSLPVAPLLGTTVDDPGRASVPAQAIRSDGRALPWTIRSGNLTYIAEVPLAFTSESDRTLILSDLLFDALAPATPARHRALVRLEDIGPDADPTQLMAVAQYLAGKKIPFGFIVYPRYRDPLGVNNPPGTEYTLADRPSVVNAIRYMLNHGGTMVMHGWTHQYSDATNPHVYNPYNGQSADDAEFYYAYLQPPGPAIPPTESQQLTSQVVWQGPVAEDSLAWASGRLTAAATDFEAAGLSVPRIYEFPHYFASVLGYQAVAARFTTRYERSIYPKGLLTHSTLDYGHIVGQFFPFVVTDLYGMKVLPENLGNYEPSSQNQNPPRYPSQIASNAAKNLVVRDGFASFFYHPYYGANALKLIIEGGTDETGTRFTGILGLGYSFVSPASL
jgi:uncharacterized protein YdaL